MYRPSGWPTKCGRWAQSPHLNPLHLVGSTRSCAICGSTVAASMEYQCSTPVLRMRKEYMAGSALSAAMSNLGWQNLNRPSLQNPELSTAAKSQRRGTVVITRLSF